MAKITSSYHEDLVDLFIDLFVDLLVGISVSKQASLLLVFERECVGSKLQRALLAAAAMPSACAAGGQWSPPVAKWAESSAHL